jgi:predicted exporter
MSALVSVWTRPRRLAVIAVALGIAAIGLVRLHPDDDVRRMQSLSPALLADQANIRRLSGGIGEGPFLLVRAKDDEAALRAEETLVDRLEEPRKHGALAGWLAPALYVPSAERQRDNRALIQTVLEPLLPAHWQRLGLEGGPRSAEAPDTVLTLSAALAADAPFASLVIAPGVHVVLLEGLAQPDAIAAIANAIPGITYVDPAAEFSALLGRYRVRAIGLLAVSALLMLPPLAWRYGRLGAIRVLMPPSLAVLLAATVRAIAGSGFSFFDAMALVLVLSIGVDYAIFCAESQGDRAPVTMLAVSLAAATALLSFGMLALSQVAAVHSFGSTMTIGILLAFAFAPMARRAAT